jgi:hypothetical protein
MFEQFEGRINKEHLIKSERCHCERSEAIHVFDLSNIHGLPRRCAPRNDGFFRCSLTAAAMRKDNPKQDAISR